MWPSLREGAVTYSSEDLLKEQLFHRDERWNLVWGHIDCWECDISLCRVVISTLESQPPGLRMCSFHVECIVPIQAILGSACVRACFMLSVLYFTQAIVGKARVYLVR